MVLNPETGNIPLQFHVVFYDDFSTVPFMMEVTITQHLKYLVQLISKISSTEIIDLEDTWFTPNLEEYPIKTPGHYPSITPDNNNKTPMLLKSKLHVHEGL